MSADCRGFYDNQLLSKDRTPVVVDASQLFIDVTEPIREIPQIGTQVDSRLDAAHEVCERIDVCAYCKSAGDTTLDQRRGHPSKRVGD